MSAVPPPAEPAAAPVVPGFTLQELLGRGGSGEVWRAVPRGGGAPVAVKVLLDGDPERQAREAALLAELDHPHLVRLHEVVHQPRRGNTARVALVLDLLEGGSLAALLAHRGRLRPGEVVTAIAPIAAALAAAHDRGVVHGDLSPGNIVFTAEGRPVLTDLGMARVIGEQGAAGLTPAYVDPTVARGGAPGPASDVFGVAAAAFHALTGVPPWNAATPAETVRVAAEGLLPDLAELAPGAPAQLVEVIQRGLAADPHERGSAAAFALDLRHSCRPEPVRLPVAGVPDQELGRTGYGRRTELTHLDPGRRPPPAADPPPAPWRLGGVVRDLLGRVTRIRVRARVVTAVAIAVLVVGAAVSVGTAVLQRGSATRPAGEAAPAAVPSAPTTPAEPRTAQDWTAVVEQLYARRADAFTRGSPELLGQVYSPGSPQLEADRSALESLLRAGQKLRGFLPATVRVSDVDVSADRAELRLTDSWSSYQIVTSRDGRPVSEGAGRPETPVRLVLVRTPDGWRIESVERLT